MDNTNNIHEFFSPDGDLAGKFPRYEHRPQQADMAEAIRDAIDARHHLIVEAGTGVGKSLAYLVPFIYRIAEEQKQRGDKKTKLKNRVVISTHTKTLQEQLINKDLPLLEEILPVTFNYELCVGSENYLCMRRLNQVWQYGLFDSKNDVKELSSIAKWSETSETGLRLELPFEPMDRIWSRICREPDMCMGRKCKARGGCFFMRSKIRQSDADILVVNHHLFFTNTASGGKLLPEYDAVVFDEAQSVEEVATDNLGITISNYGINHLMDLIYNPKNNRGLVHRITGVDEDLFKSIGEDVRRVEIAAENFFTEILDEFAGSGLKPIVKRIHSPNLCEDTLSDPLMNLHEHIKMLLDTLTEEDLIQELTAYANRILGLRTGIDVFIKHSYKEYVYYLEIVPGTRFTRIWLRAAPVNVADVLKVQLFNRTSPVILTSATLSINRSFGYIKERLGLEDTKELLLDSPFDYMTQVTLYVAEELPDPSYKIQEFHTRAIERVGEILRLTEGHAFVLFTSYDTLGKTYTYLKENLPEMQLLKQGDMPRWQMLEEFKKSDNPVLLGTNTFWQGVDVPGCALQCVIIFKLPFSVPDNPVVEAKMEYLSKQGKDPFTNYQVPQAIIMLKQGFGRLIRSSTDTGMVAILDPRLRTRFYGRLFLNSLPECRVITALDE